MRELAIVKYIKEYGLSKTIDDFKLKTNICEHKILLKYNQLESPMEYQEVRECRGLILELDTWKVMNCGFYKFFNVQERYADNIDWNTANIFEKLDGSCLTIYFDWNKNMWCVSTTGTLEADGNVNGIDGTTFSKLFWNTIESQSKMFKKYKNDLNFLLKGTTYIFELCTPFNIVVKPHTTSSVTLLGARNLDTLQEATYNELKEVSHVLNVPLVKSFNFKNTNKDFLIKTFEDIKDPFFEGYVVCDGNFNRVKIKTPSYISLHHLKSKSSPYEIMGVIKNNELDEFLAYVPERRGELLELKVKYDELIFNLEQTWEKISCEIFNLLNTGSYIERKVIANIVLNISKKNKHTSFTGLFFSLYDGKFKDVKTYISCLDNKKLYNLI